MAASKPVRAVKLLVGVQPSEQDIADLDFLALGSDSRNNDEILSQIKKGQYINVADERSNTIMHKVVERGLDQEDVRCA